MADETSADINNPALQPNGEDTSPAIGLISQYVKDLSFENPNAPAVYQWQDAPQVDVQFNIAADSVGENLYEVTLKIDVTSKTDQGTSFVIDLKYAGLFGRDLLRLLLEQAVEIDGFEKQRGEAAVAHDVRDDPACEGEQDARRFGKEERLELVVGHVAHAEQPRIFQLDDEADQLGILRGDIDLQRYFEQIVADIVGTDVELDVDLRRVLHLINRGRIRILERQILHILRDQADRRQIVFAVRKGFGGEFGRGVVGHVGLAFPVVFIWLPRRHNRSIRRHGRLRRRLAVADRQHNGRP